MTTKKSLLIDVWHSDPLLPLISQNASLAVPLPKILCTQILDSLNICLTASCCTNKASSLLSIGDQTKSKQTQHTCSETRLSDPSGSWPPGSQDSNIHSSRRLFVAFSKAFTLLFCDSCAKQKTCFFSFRRQWWTLHSDTGRRTVLQLACCRATLANIRLQSMPCYSWEEVTEKSMMSIDEQSKWDPSHYSGLPL